MIFYYVRHGDPIYSPDSLTPLGERQAEAVGRKLSQYDFEKIYSSSSKRAMDTAKPLCELLKIEPEILDWAKEDYAWFEFSVPRGKGRNFIYNNPELFEVLCSKEVFDMGYEWYNHEAFKEAKCKEGMERIGKFADDFFMELGYRHDREKGLYEVVNPNDNRIALFAHEGFGMAFLSHILDIPYPLFAKFSMGHTGVTVIEFNNDQAYARPSVLTFSNDAHLYKENLPLKHRNTLYI